MWSLLLTAQMASRDEEALKALDAVEAGMVETYGGFFWAGLFFDPNFFFDPKTCFLLFFFCCFVWGGGIGEEASRKKSCLKFLVERGLIFVSVFVLWFSGEGRRGEVSQKKCCFFGVWFFVNTFICLFFWFLEGSAGGNLFGKNGEK